MFPPANQDETRVLSFVNKRDRIHFRHHVWVSNNRDGKTHDNRKNKWVTGEQKEVTLTEVGPRFVMRPFKIELGTVDMRDLETEWALRPYFNTRKLALTA